MNKYNDEPMSVHNEAIYNRVVAMELSVLDCEVMGLTVERIEFDGTASPRIFVQDCDKTLVLLKAGRAQPYGRIRKNGVWYDLIQMRNRECKILWQTDRWH